MAVTDDGTLVVAGEEAEALLPGGDRVLTPADLERVTRNIADRLSWLAAHVAQDLRKEAYGHILEAEQTPTVDDVKPVARALVEQFEAVTAIGDRIKKGAQAFLDEAGQEAITAQSKVKGRDAVQFRIPGALYTVTEAGTENIVWDSRALATVLSAVLAPTYAAEHADDSPTLARELLDAADAYREEMGSRTEPAADNDPSAIDVTRRLKQAQHAVDTEPAAAYRRGLFDGILGLLDYANVTWKVTPLKALAAQLEERGQDQLAGMIRDARTDTFAPRPDGGFQVKRDARKTPAKKA